MHDTLYFCWQCFSCKTWKDVLPISTHIMETAPQCRPVWAHSRVLMMLPPLANCCVLAARWNVNGSTCDYKLHRGATQLTGPRVYLGHNVNICMRGGRHRCEATPECSNFLPFQCFPIFVLAVSAASRAETINPLIQVIP